MIKITDRASEKLKKLLLLCRDHPETGLRLKNGSMGQFGLVLGTEADGDHVVEHEGLKVLLVGRELILLLNGVTIDIENNGNKVELVMFKR